MDPRLAGLNSRSQEVKISYFLHLHPTMNLGQFIRVVQLPVDEGLNVADLERLRESVLFQPLEGLQRSGGVFIDPIPQRRLTELPEVLQGDHGLAIGMAADDRMGDAVQDAAQLEGRRGGTGGRNCPPSGR